LRTLLNAQQNIEVVGEAANGREAVKVAQELSPDIVIMDISMPELNGIHATRQIRRLSPQTRVLVLSSYDDDECVDKVTEAGAKGFLSKCSAANHLSQAIQAVRSGQSFHTPEVAKRMRDRRAALAQQGLSEGDPFALTPRQGEVLQLIAEGLSNKEIGVRIGISIKTVEKHRQAVMNALNIHETAGLTRYAIRRGIVPPKAAENAPVRVLKGI
jgi:DNA-binding NarL/FixJ family response regulator